MPPPADSHPCLPLDLLAQFEADPTIPFADSTIFSPDFHRFRYGALKLSKDRTPMEIEVVRPADRASDTLIPGIPEQLRGAETFGEGDNKTFLHLAAHDGDVPLAYEVVRMGIVIDRTDKNGATPLSLALKYLQSMGVVLRIASQPGFIATVPPSARAALEPEYVRKRISCLVKIATLLVEQHADVNAGAFGYTPLTLAAEAGQWTLVELLLRHGAHRPRPDTLRSLPSADRLRLTSILNQTPAAHPRPAQPCPCYSGEPLSACHAAGRHMLYPAHFLCGCGKRRTYGACCGKHGVIVEERWDPTEKWIMPVQVRTVRLPELAPELKPHFEAGMRQSKELLAGLDSEEMKEVTDMLQTRKGEMMREMLRASGKEGDVDPAFMFAMDSVDFFARPWEGQLSKIEAQQRMNEWNTAVDRYIATEGDPRSRFNIELESKIGLHGGPLYRYCEAEGCDHVEKRDVESMKRCSGCKLVFYCSQECQVGSWQYHKQECKKRSHRLQQLPSQHTLEFSVTGMQVMGGMSMGQTNALGGLVP
ncbi:hypothetical protein EIP86_007632 [Pleurotus ostreatoroseus]|nr:hypothetical protein EIP86_007632 [Pleurotus ostreatoroseus]